MSERVMVVGDALLDRDVEGRSERLCPDAPVPVVDQEVCHTRPGGAGLAAALLAAAGTPVTLVTAIAKDRAGGELARGLTAAGVDLINLGLDGDTPEKVRVLDCGQPLLRLDRGRGGRIRSVGSPLLASAVEAVGAVLVSDYGYGVAVQPQVREALAGRPAGLPLLWDPHPLGPEPVEGVTMATPNLSEATRFVRGAAASDEPGVADLALELLRIWKAEAVCVTRGGDGAVLASEDGKVRGYGSDWVDGDACGAGDSFAAEAASVMAMGGSREQAIRAAIAVSGGFVAAGGARAAVGDGRSAPIAGADGQGQGSSPLSIEPAIRLAEEVRRSGGSVVATGGCFDLLHTGHLRTLEAARGLGDCLVVLLNGNRSVERLKGAERPLVDELDRAAMLTALRCVDEVAIFDEESPADALRLLRPNIWAKGGDYAIEELAEKETLAEWGGRTVILPYLDGRSTTQLIDKAGRHG